MNKNTVRLHIAGRALLRLEALATLMACLFAFHQFGGSWLAFLGLFLAPDIAMLGYLRNARVGAWTYNAAHSYAVPAVLAAAVWLIAGGIPSPLWLVWPVHIAFDRALGFGLKSEAGFRHTHLG